MFSVCERHNNNVGGRKRRGRELECENFLLQELYISFLSLLFFVVLLLFLQFLQFFCFFLNPCKDYTQREGQDAGKLHPCPSCSHVCIRRLPSLSSHESHFSKGGDTAGQMKMCHLSPLFLTSTVFPLAPLVPPGLLGICGC